MFIKINENAFSRLIDLNLDRIPQPNKLFPRSSSAFPQKNRNINYLFYHLFIVASSCRHLQDIGQKDAIQYPDGVYDIYPDPNSDTSVRTYCDMSRDGGGWTLLVASHTNSWTAANVLLRNAESPNLYQDYSILKYGDKIKDNLNVEGLSFEYRLEAQRRGE